MEMNRNSDSIILIFIAFYFHSSIQTNKYSLKRAHLSHCLIDCIHCGSSRATKRSSNTATISSRTIRRLGWTGCTGGRIGSGASSSPSSCSRTLTGAGRSSTFMSPMSMHKLCRMQQTLITFWINSTLRSCMPDCKIWNRRLSIPYERSTTFRVARIALQKTKIIETTIRIEKI